MIFQNRKQAGQKLTEKLLHYKNKDLIVLALPRGGVPVAAEIAEGLRAPLEVLLVRKIGAPANPEVAVGAVSEDEKPIYNQRVISRLHTTTDKMRPTLQLEIDNLRRQRETFRQGRPLRSVKGKTVILVDDGLATGATLSAAVRFLKSKSPREIIVAVPVAATSSAQSLRSKVEEVVALVERVDFDYVGKWYGSFPQVQDQEVIDLLRAHETSKPQTPPSPLLRAIGSEAVPVHRESDFASLIHALKDKRIVMLGEASHGTHEYYQFRRLISQTLLREHGFKFIAVEGDWPDAHRLHKYVQKGGTENAKQVLLQNHRWPTWMWANEEIVRLAEWMKDYGPFGFFGLDVYSLFDSIHAIVSYLQNNHSELAEEVKKRYACFDPYEGDEISYARSLFQYPEGCRTEVLKNLRQLLEMRVWQVAHDGEELFSSQQNARIIVNAEAYYRAMLEGDKHSWNIRDTHMLETLDRLLERSGEGAKAIVWAHNTHVGDYRATDMLNSGYVNIGGLARQKYGADNVALVGFGSHEGEVLAGSAWGAPERVMPLPPSQEGSYESYFHEVAHHKKWRQFYVLLQDREDSPFKQILGHRAVGVVYDPRHEKRGNYVPTSLSKRYDAFVFVDRTHALKSLHAQAVRGEFPETWPSGQ